MSPSEDAGDEEAKEINLRVFGLQFTCSSILNKKKKHAYFQG